MENNDNNKNKKNSRADNTNTAVSDGINLLPGNAELWQRNLCRAGFDDFDQVDYYKSVSGDMETLINELEKYEDHQAKEIDALNAQFADLESRNERQKAEVLREREAFRAGKIAQYEDTLKQLKALAAMTPSVADDLVLSKSIMSLKDAAYDNSIDSGAFSKALNNVRFRMEKAESQDEQNKNNAHEDRNEYTVDYYPAYSIRSTKNDDYEYEL